MSRQTLTWIFVALVLTLALAPAVDVLHQRGLKRRGAAILVVFLLGLAFLAGIGALLIPPLVDQVSGFAKAAPGYARDLTHGRGPLGVLETKYHVVEKVREAVSSGGGATKFAGGAGTVLSLTRGVVTAVVGFVTIIFLTLFMLLEGPAWWERGIGMLPEESRPRWRNVGRQIGQTVSGYVTGNLLISLVAGTLSAIVLLVMGVPFPLALGLLVAILDLIPLAGATLAGILLAVVGFLTSVTAGIVFFVLYQQCSARSPPSRSPARCRSCCSTGCATDATRPATPPRRSRPRPEGSSPKPLVSLRRLGLRQTREWGVVLVEVGGDAERLVVDLRRAVVRGRGLGRDVGLGRGDRGLAVRHGVPPTRSAAGAPHAWSTEGIRTDPSSSWPFSSSAIMCRQVTAVPFSVATCRGRPDPPGR